MARWTILLVALLFLLTADARPAEENKSVFGSTYDEIVVESTLTVRGKGGASRQSRGKKLEVVQKPEALTDGVSIELSRPKRQQNFNRRQRPQGFGGRPGFGGPGFQGGFPSGSASAANAASQGFHTGGPNGFGASASNAGTQGFQFGPHGISGSAAQSANQVYQLPGGGSINVAFSNGFSAGPGGASRTGSNSVTITGANGRQRPFG